jgi:ribonuclease HI
VGANTATAVCVLRGEQWSVCCRGEPAETTNNRMELMAPIRVLESLTRPVVVRLHTGHPDNERADQLAARGLQEACV